jgi:4-amino-4-deoxy-L-arabinose transferase-like glycosyltransferase
MRARLPLVAIAAAVIVPRLAVLLHERRQIVAAFTEKSWDFAKTFVESGTFGFIPHVPSASTQPLYGFFLVPIVWIFGTGWLWVGLAQILVAVATGYLVHAVGLRVLSRRGALVAALVTTLHPYLVWHDVHLNREILDQLVGAALMLVALLAFERGTVRLAAAVGAICGIAVLSNTRLVLLPIVLAAVLARRVPLLGLGALLVAAALVVSPWVIRNRVQVGCFAITTDAKALWKANNVHTYGVLAHGGWIDDVPNPPGAPKYTPEFAGALWRVDHRFVRVDECAQMHFYEHLVARFWEHHPGEKAKLAVQATGMLWSPTVRKEQADAGSSGGLARYRSLVEALWAVPVFLLAALGLALVRAPFLRLAIVFLVYETVAAWVFAGTTRYRIAWDFVLVVLAVGGIETLLSRRAASRSR